MRSLESAHRRQRLQEPQRREKSELLGQFKTAPNDDDEPSKGLAVQKAKAEGLKRRSGEKKPNDNQATGTKTPDAGTFSVGGTNYRSREGKLVDARARMPGPSTTSATTR